MTPSPSKKAALSTYVILLRGIMPTGKNKVPMAPLRDALAKAGLKDVQTYIQSGNVIASTSLSQAGVEQLVHDIIAREFGGDIAVLARTPKQMQSILANNPFPDADQSRLYFCLLAAKPESAKLKAFLTQDYSPDQLQIVGDVVYLYYATKYSDSKVNNNFVERKLGVSATTRNFNTVSKLIELSQKQHH